MAGFQWTWAAPGSLPPLGGQNAEPPAKPQAGTAQAVGAYASGGMVEVCNLIRRRTVNLLSRSRLNQAYSFAECAGRQITRARFASVAVKRRSCPTKAQRGGDERADACCRPKMHSHEGL